jgi:tetratricopeptide (TPR) repeat protein
VEFHARHLVLLSAASLFAADTAEAIFQRAAAALVAQNYETAERDFQAVLKLQPANVGALGNLGVVYSRTHQYDHAIEVYQRALKIAPGDKALTTNLGLAYIKQERFSAAAPIFEKLTAADPANLQARELLATCRLSLGQYEKALTVIAPLLEAEPTNPGILYMQGVALSRLKRPAEAREAFTKMMSAATPAQASFLMGKAGYETGNFEEAAASFRQALAADPNLEGAHRELGKTLISLRDDDNAEKELRLAGPADTEALYFLGALLSQKQPTEAEALLKKAREQSPDFWGPLYYLGRLEAEQGRTKEAIPLLERAAKMNPEESAIQYQLGRAMQKAGREPEARAAFEKVKKLKENSLRKEVDTLSPNNK